VTPHPEPLSAIAGSVLPLQRAEELLASLHEVVSARIVADASGNVEAIHVLVTGDLTPKQMVRNVESALMAQLGMRVDHRKISVATTVRRPEAPPMTQAVSTPQQGTQGAPFYRSPVQPVQSVPAPAIEQAPAPAPFVAEAPSAVATPPEVRAQKRGDADEFYERVTRTTPAGEMPRRELYFEDVEIRGSRSKGMICKVTLTRGSERDNPGEHHERIIGECEGTENDRNRVELAARATLAAVGMVQSAERKMNLEGAKVIEAFDREIVLVGIMVRVARTNTLLMGSCEITDSAETASALAVLNATNRWVEGVK
jgi:hypothetical protein